jgi:hypothetical protein
MEEKIDHLLKKLDPDEAEKLMRRLNSKYPKN